MADDLHSVYLQFCRFGDPMNSGAMTGKNFLKLCDDTKLTGRGLDRTRIDLIFSQVKQKGTNKISFREFQAALDHVAVHKNVDTATVVHQILTAGGPIAYGTAADASGVYNKLTDTSLYTGAHKERFDEAGHGRGLGGRDSVPKGHGAGQYRGGDVKDLSQITRPNLGGVTHQVASMGVRDEPRPAARVSRSNSRRNSASPIRAAAAAAAAAAPEQAPSRAPVPRSGSRKSASPTRSRNASRSGSMKKSGGSLLHDAFLQFIGIADKTGTMDNARFQKMCKDCKLVDATSADIIFAKAKPKGERRLTFDQFEAGALPLLAERMFPKLTVIEGVEAVVDKILKSQGPSRTNVTETTTDGNVYSKLTDTTAYTGMYAERFNADGTGRGAAGNDVGGKGSGSVPQYRGGNVKDLSQIVRNG